MVKHERAFMLPVKEQHQKSGTAIHFHTICVMILAGMLIGGVWFGLSELDAYARIAFITFGLAIIGWVFTKINDTYVALVAALIGTILSASQPEQFFETLGESTIWLLFASFIIAAAFAESGLSHRLAVYVTTHVSSVNHLFYMLTSVLIATAFIVPATSGRAALMLPVFLAISKGITNPRIGRALALLFPTIILLSAVASMIGAGAHLVMIEILWHMNGERVGFGQWILLGLPLALVSSFVSCWVILHLFLSRSERRLVLHFTPEQLAQTDSLKNTTVTGSLGRKERTILAVIGLLIVFWSTEGLHGVNSTLIALIGALVVTMPNVGILSFKDAVKHVEWNLLLFMAATLVLSEALIKSGAAEWLVNHMFTAWGGQASLTPTSLVIMVIMVSLLAHLVITSRTARSSVLVPLVILLVVSLGYNATAFAFLSTAAAGFCLTLPVSAKPLAIFSQVEVSTFKPRHQLLLSGVLFPIHVGLLMIFAFFVWPMSGLSLTNEKQPTSEPSGIVTWIEKPFEWGNIPPVPERIAQPTRDGYTWVRAVMDHPATLSQPVSEGADWVRDRISLIQQQLQTWWEDLSAWVQSQFDRTENSPSSSEGVTYIHLC
ncbi:MAG: hypothetical protein GFH27_549283n115 [Chloroflexi bacterium AL-W]|nr:hypothetical protein [Chloroflexi bacterium AL-N1]NOK64764.1 hypothetical protein [Chloroflexi bacterium AL-N10]NOK76005.1 hypothetical protein [Chloroflexi bacterium AL-N5]NOK80236.1 hypothetical protein [Chloroflexi bacterium AL-W]NOK86749.1 hypothetical protein [Chloroflexi bacterium AL-N15]